MPALARPGPWPPRQWRTARCPRTTAHTSCVTPFVGPLATSGAPASTAPAGPGTGLAVQLGHPPHHLLWRHVLHVRRDGPPVPERVHDVPVPVAVELVLGGTLQRRAALHGPGEDGIYVLDV